MESLYLILWTLIVGAIGLLYFLHYKAHFWKRKGILHLKPILGIGNSAPLFFNTKPFLEYVKEVYDHFPNARYFGMMDLTTPVAVLRDPDLIKETCVKNFDHFLDHQSFVTEEMDPIFGKNVFALRGERWREMRNILSPSFTATKMKFMFELIEKCAQNFVQYFLEHPEKLNLIETRDAFSRYTNDVIATAAFGISVDSLKNENNEFYLHGKNATAFSLIFALKFLIFRIFPKFMRLIGVPFMPGSTNKFFYGIIKETVKVREEKKIVRPDLIHIMMEAKDKENGVELTVDDIVAQSFIFFLAGFDTTSTAMCFVAHELAINPEIQEKLRNEVDAVIKSEGGKISYETLSKMKYLDMVISETLRKYPPASISDRICTKEFTLPKPTEDSPEFKIKPGMVLWIPIQGFHYDPMYFPDPEKFDPERFSDENKDQINPYAYMPFGVGPRKCIAFRFALMEMKIIFTYIMQNFVLEKSAKTVHPLKFKKGFAIAVEGGAYVKFTKRNH